MGEAPNVKTEVTRPAKAAAEEAKAKVEPTAESPNETAEELPNETAGETPRYPTPAVKTLLVEAKVPESLWARIPRTGKGGRMTQSDARAFIEQKETTSHIDKIDITLDNLKAKLQEVYEYGNNGGGGGRAWAFALLARFGVNRISDLKPEQYSDFVERAEAVVAGGYDPRDSANG